MFTNYFKIIYRNLRRYKSYTLINIIGMAIGIAAMVWGYQMYRYAFSFDNFQPHPDQVYRALTYKKDGEGLKGVFPMAAVLPARRQPAATGSGRTITVPATSMISSMGRSAVRAWRRIASGLVAS